MAEVNRTSSMSAVGTTLAANVGLSLLAAGSGVLVARLLGPDGRGALLAAQV
jgi:hypothetical protein